MTGGCATSKTTFIVVSFHFCASGTIPLLYSDSIHLTPQNTFIYSLSVIVQILTSERG